MDAHDISVLVLGTPRATPPVTGGTMVCSPRPALDGLAAILPAARPSGAHATCRGTSQEPTHPCTASHPGSIVGDAGWHAGGRPRDGALGDRRGAAAGAGAPRPCGSRPGCVPRRRWAPRRIAVRSRAARRAVLHRAADPARRPAMGRAGPVRALEGSCRSRPVCDAGAPRVLPDRGNGIVRAAGLALPGSSRHDAAAQPRHLERCAWSRLLGSGGDGPRQPAAWLLRADVDDAR